MIRNRGRVLGALPLSGGEREQAEPAAQASLVTKLSAHAISVALAVGAIIALAPAACAQEARAAREQAAVEAGEAVYNDNCQTCHGDRLVSTGQTFDLRRLTADERARFENSVRNGKNQMPPWKDVLSEEEIDQLWHYIRANAYRK